MVGVLWLRAMAKYVPRFIKKNFERNLVNFFTLIYEPFGGYSARLRNTLC
jgi:hypothetical protein